MARKRNRESAEVNSSSMADIAFLLLVFFLVTTTIPNEKGLLIQLPPADTEITDVKLKERNVFTVRINSADRLLVENEPLEDVYRLKQMVKDHVMNPRREGDKAESPEKAVISLKNDRGTSYDRFITVLDQLQGAYYEIYAERAGGLTAQEYRNLDRTDPRQLELYNKGKEGIPMAISIAQPTK
ncbi:ExbD/TolR family protein [Cesiribacter andamanensis]|uniref:Protein TolR n=1 Tax=Cesiribacter andamanensis AMV16 TaxID=1279009 RepID=M7N0R1_9BACT|nr:biopolymer transporter ExbD [Cesiribacter andamanensis]EMR00902.1 protein TolR [Cesiribacter andamanensis AMV16]